MAREIVTINIGECGVRLGESEWRQYCMEHNIDKSGNHKYYKQGPTKRIHKWYNAEKHINNDLILCFFDEIADGHYLPRNIMIDLDPTTIDNIKTADYSDLFDDEFLVSANEDIDASHNFARGYCSVGTGIIDIINDKLRKLLNNCDNLQGFIINHSISGGTGSGLGALVLQQIAQHNKKIKIGFEVFGEPYPYYSYSVVAPYNALLSIHCLIENVEASIILDNKAIYEICQKWLDIRLPKFYNLNNLISKAISSITVGLRFGGNINANLHDFVKGLVPFPRLHFLMTSLAPVCAENMVYYNRSIAEISEYCMFGQNFFTKIADFDAEEDKYLGISVNYRGHSIDLKEVNDTIKLLQTNKRISLVEWNPTEIKVGINNEQIGSDPGWGIGYDDIRFCKRSVVMTGNNTAISRVFRERICTKYDVMYTQRAFVHWYINEGMEESELCEAREDLGFLEFDYLHTLCDEMTDDVEI